MLTKLLIGLGVVLGILALVISSRPAKFHVERSATMSAPAAAIFVHVNDLHTWAAWSPWAKLDPNAKETFEGPAAGTGAAMSWAGNREVGEGTMTITESRPYEFIRLRLDFRKPFVATSTAEFTFQPKGKETLVTWSMYGPNNFVAKAISLVMDCDKMIGGQFDSGLAQLKTLMEPRK